MRLMLLALLWPFVTLSAFSQSPASEPLRIAGDDLPFEVRVAPADADNFARRINKLPRLEDRPNAVLPSFRVTTSYWEVAVPLEPEEEDEDLAPGETADYYPDGGFVRVELDDDPVWLVLNLRQRAILDRYIRLAQAGQIDEEPSTIDVLAAAAAGGEVFQVSAGPDSVEPEVATALLTMLSEANPEPALDTFEPPRPTNDGFWLTVTLPEGRTLRYFYDGELLTESLGTERYETSSASEMLEQLRPESFPAIEQESPAGSLLWWPVMLGAGAAAIGAAVWLRRRHSGL